jgi:hypothetical protein
MNRTGCGPWLIEANWSILKYLPHNSRKTGSQRMAQASLRYRPTVDSLPAKRAEKCCATISS